MPESRWKNLMVKKFGGASVGSLEKINLVADKLAKSHQKGQRQVAVISAMAGQTNRLAKMAEEINPSARGEAYDMLLSSGEQASLALLSLALEKRGLKTSPLLAHQAGIQTDSLFSKACIQSIETDRIERALKEGAIPLLAGFQGITEQNQITTLGRGGSDLTAVAVALVLGQKVCEIYTDVPGVFTGDPGLIPSARKLNEMGFSEMMEMSSLGSKVLHFRCVELAAKHDIKIHVRHAFSEEEGTWIMRKAAKKTLKKESAVEGSAVSAVSHDLNAIVVKMEKIPRGAGFLADVFQKLGERAVFVDIISQSGVSGGPSLAFSVPKTDEAACRGILKTLMRERSLAEDAVSVIDQVAKISVVGVGMAHHSGVAGRFFSVFQRLDVPLYLVTTSEIKISAIIDREHLKRAAQALHEEFGLAGQPFS